MLKLDFGLQHERPLLCRAEHAVLTCYQLCLNTLNHFFSVEVLSIHLLRLREAKNLIKNTLLQLLDVFFFLIRIISALLT